MTPDIIILKAAVRGIYDLQQLRIASGLRLCANFRAKLNLGNQPAGDDEDDDAEAAEAKKVIDLLKASYRRLTDGIARNRTLPARSGFVGDELISTHSELVLVDYYMGLEGSETKQFRQLTDLLDPIPIYDRWLRDQEGVGPAMAGVLIAYFDPHKARHVSSFWKYAGLDVGPDNAGRSRRAEHMVDRDYIDKNGETKTRKSLTYEPFLKTKLSGVLAGSFLRCGAEPWRGIYDGYKWRLETDPSREKITVVKWKKRQKDGDDVSRLWTPGRINNASKRYMIKMFLAQFWHHWRTLEGLPVTEPYAVAKQGQRPHGKAA